MSTTVNAQRQEASLAHIKDGVDSLREAQEYLKCCVKANPDMEISLHLIQAQIESARNQLDSHASRLHSASHSGASNPLFGFQFQSKQAPLATLWK